MERRHLAPEAKLGVLGASIAALAAQMFAGPISFGKKEAKVRKKTAAQLRQEENYRGWRRNRDRRDRARAQRPPHMAIVNRMSNWHRHQWVKAGRPTEGIEEFLVKITKERVARKMGTSVAELFS